MRPDEKRWGALIADDEPAARRGVRQLLAAFPEFVVAGEWRKGAGGAAAPAYFSAGVAFPRHSDAGYRWFRSDQATNRRANACGRFSYGVRPVCNQGFRNRSSGLSRK